jgi:GntR family transcriptional regulator, transcriptional repressor for pyruvate dehydrogenase complex
MAEDFERFTAGGGKSAVDLIVASMRRMISEGGLSVGDKLPTERELCDRFQTSRNTVREAMRILKAYGIVDVRPKVGATIVDNRMSRALDLFSFNVMEVSRDTFSDIQGFRVLLEVASVDLIFDRVTDQDLKDLHQVNRDLAASRSVPDAAEQDFRFHTRLVSVLGNKAMLDVYQIMKPVILRIMERGKTRRSIEGQTFREHESVLEALAARDRIAFQYRMKTHLESGYATFNEEQEV